MIKRFVFALLSSALVTSVAHAGGHCAAGKTLTDGKLTIATGNPAYYPWVMDDAPEAGKALRLQLLTLWRPRWGFPPQMWSG